MQLAYAGPLAYCWSAQDELFTQPARETAVAVSERKPLLGAAKRQDDFLRCRILARIRRFLRPCLRRPFPDFFVPTRTPND